ncbi:arylsulfotransferase family protein [Winogradskyella poriferorum]|uniref:arylsulfotransferase family protein n=1 Tax=Winogradskyella poriferorum TaxID=307627 RepID=UPI003D64CB3E
MKIIRKLALVIIGIFVLMLWSGIVRNVALGQRAAGPITGPIKTFSELPSNMKMAYKHYFQAPEYYLKTRAEDVNEINNLTYDLFGTYAYRDGSQFNIELKNFKNQDVIKNWILPIEFLGQHYEVGQNDRLLPSKLLPNRGIVASLDERPGLVRIDSTSKIVWFNNEFIFHHGLNFDHDGNIWTPGVKHEDGIIIPNTLSVDGSKIDYRDDVILSIDVETGKTLYSKSLTSLFLENDLEELLNKANHVKDPFHLNDVQPVLNDHSEYFKKGDLFLSFRHLSAIILFRPSTNKVIKVLEGPFSFQHDIDIVSDSTVALFNNNTASWDVMFNKFEFKPSNGTIQRKISHSNVLIYNFDSDSYNALYEDQFIENEIFTSAEGLYELLPNGDLFIEEQGQGVLWVLNKNGVVLKTTLKSDIDGYHYLPNWTTIYTNINF